MEKLALKKILKERNTINKSESVIKCKHFLAGWQSGYAAACKAVYSGSIPDSASSINNNFK